MFGSEGNPENSKIIKTYMDQYYDQVIRKEMAAAELDCQYAKKARLDLLAMERTNQILVISGQDSEGYPNPFLDDIWEKIEKLAKIETECTKTYRVNGTWGLSSLTGEINSLENPFTLASSGGPGCTGEVQFSGGSTGGAVSCSQTCEGLDFVGDGTYIIDITEDGGTISGGCSIYLPASGGLDIIDEGPIEATLQLVP